jgi:hypothetical protein
MLTYACPIWEHVADAHLFKLQKLQNRVLRSIGNLDKGTQSKQGMWISKSIYVYGHITRLCRTQAEVILPNIHSIGQGESMQRKSKRSKLGGAQTYGRSLG